MPTSDLAGLHSSLVGWYLEHRRDLPWRRTRDPYAIWVSEVMLQQTQVNTVISYYTAFLERFSDASQLAAADPDTVRSMWSGLGYYRRARAMMAAAERIVAEHDGRLPSDPEALRALPGFGPYTTGAVASIAFGLPVAAVDGNVIRVVSRLRRVSGDPSKAATKRTITAFVQELLNLGSTSELTQGLMELGASHCSVRKPTCEQCPIRSQCEAYEHNQQEEFPAKVPKKKRGVVHQEAMVHYLEDPKRLWLVQQGEDGLFAGLFLPRLRETTDTAVHVRHRLTHRDLLFTVTTLAKEPPKGSPGRWVPLEELAQLGLPTLTSKLLRAALPAEWTTGLRGNNKRQTASGG